jgi:hypothetical protein
MRRSLDLFLNIFIPIITGSGIYYSAKNLNIEGFIKHQLPDGLWAYAMLSSILIIWNRNIQLFWIAAVFFVFILFELLQFTHIIPGTGDVWDIITYCIFSCAALYMNVPLKKFYYFINN